MSNPDPIQAQLEQRLELASRPEYEGTPMRRVDYTSLLLVTLVLPVVLLVIARWML